jgi:hypothetical protein
MSRREIIAVCYQVHTKHINALCVCVCVCVRGVEFLILKQVVYTGAVIYAGNIVCYITSYEINAMKYRPLAYTTPVYSTYKFLAL